jgi:hypothetical protein
MVSNKPRLGMGQVYRKASAEAKRRGDRRVSTEHIALAMLVDPGLGDRSRARCQPGVSEGRAGNPGPRGAHISGDRRYCQPSLISGRVWERLRLTPAGRAVFTGLRREASGERPGVKQVLFALLARERPDPAAELFHAIGVDRSQIRNRLRER